jgi:hypothetical protein
LELTNDEVVKLLDSYEQESKAIKEEILTICWYMRGSISYSEGMLLSPEDRKIISKIVASNLETTKESGLPFF